MYLVSHQISSQYFMIIIITIMVAKWRFSNFPIPLTLKGKILLLMGSVPFSFINPSIYQSSIHPFVHPSIHLFISVWTHGLLILYGLFITVFILTLRTVPHLVSRVPLQAGSSGCPTFRSVQHSLIFNQQSYFLA